MQRTKFWILKKILGFGWYKNWGKFNWKRNIPFWDAELTSVVKKSLVTRLANSRQGRPRFIDQTLDEMVQKILNPTFSSLEFTPRIIPTKMNQFRIKFIFFSKIFNFWHFSKSLWVECDFEKLYSLKNHAYFSEKWNRFLRLFEIREKPIKISCTNEILSVELSNG